MATVADLAEDIAVSLGEEYGDLDIKSAFDRWVIDAFLELLLEENWPWAHLVENLETADGTASYSLDVNTGDIRTIFNTSTSTPLQDTTIDEIRQAGWTYNTEGVPTHWYQSGSSGGKLTVSLYPIPDGAYTLYVYGETQAELTATSTIPYPANTFAVIKAWVRATYKALAQDYNGADREWLKHGSLLGRLRQRYLTPRSQHREFSYSDIPTDKQDGPRLPSTIPQVTIE